MSCSINSSNRCEKWQSALWVQLLCHRRYLTVLLWCHCISLPLPQTLSSFPSVSSLYSPLHLLHLSSFLPLPVVFLFVSLFHWLQSCSRDSDIFSNLCFKACLYLDKCSICTHANTRARTRKVFLFISAQGSAMETGKDNWTNSLHHWQCHLEWIAYYSKQHNLFLSQGIKCNCFVRCFLHLPAVASAPWQSGCLDITFYF